MQNEVLAKVFEVIMLAGFGASWPFAVWKTWSTKAVAGKSPMFLTLVFLGYISGILFKVFGRFDWVIALYAFNCILVFTDLMLYVRYSRRPAVQTGG